MLFERAAVIGTGMIGGSFALAAKRNELVRAVVGVARTQRTLSEARKLGVADETTSDAAKAVARADLVYLAAPVRSIRSLLRDIADAVPKGCIITDAGSAKREIVAAASDALPSHCAFIGGHPMAGSEEAGVAAARADLFEGCSYFLTPDAQTDPQALETLLELVRGLGAEPLVIDAQAHDEFLAATSHLPHVVAAALCATLAPLGDDLARFSGTGLRDTTRIALGPDEVWRDILLSNADNLCAVLEDFRVRLDEFESALKAGDAERISTLLRLAREVRGRVSGDSSIAGRRPDKNVGPPEHG